MNHYRLLFQKFISGVFLLFNWYVPAKLTAQISIYGTVIDTVSAHKGENHLKKVFLGFYKGQEFTLIDSADILQDRSFTLKTTTKPHHGVYEIMLNKTAGMPLILSPADTQLQVELSFKNKQELNPVKAVNNENVAFNAFSIVFLQHLRHIDALTRKRQTAPHDSTYKNTLAVLKKQKYFFQKNFNERLEKISTSYPGTYTSDILTKIMYHPAYIPDSTLSFEENEQREFRYNKQHFLDGIPFKDERIINNPYINEQLFHYLLNYSSKTVEGLKECSDLIMTHAFSNKIVNEFVLSFLTDVFIKRGPDEVLNYLSDNYIEGCSNNVPEITVKRIKQRRNFKPGYKVADISLPDSAGHTINLYSIQKGKPAIIYFWSSACGHCREETPKYIQLYKQFHDQGLEIYAVSLDEKKENWINAIDKMELNWINVCDFKGYNSPAAQNYFVYATPTLILLDEAGKILKVNPPIDILKAELTRLLN